MHILVKAKYYIHCTLQFKSTVFFFAKVLLSTLKSDVSLATFEQQLSKVVDCWCVLREVEWRAVMTQTMQCSRLACHSLYHHACNGMGNGIIRNGNGVYILTYSHSRGEPVRIKDDVRDHP